MKHDIECSFDPDIIWLGEVNRQVLRLEREASVFPPGRTHLNCLLRQGGDSPAGVFLALRVGEEKLSSFAEDPSPVRATRGAFEKLGKALAAHVGERRCEEFRARTSRNLPAWGPAPEPQSRRNIFSGRAHAPAARIFYDKERFRRRDAPPWRWLKSFLGEGGLQTLDGDVHRSRKRMFVSLLTPESIGRLSELTTRQWHAHAEKWESAGRVVLATAAADATGTARRHRACRSSLVPQCDIRVYPHRTARGNIAGG